MTKNLLINLVMIIAWILNIITLYMRYDLNRMYIKLQDDDKKILRGYEMNNKRYFTIDEKIIDTQTNEHKLTKDEYLMLLKKTTKENKNLRQKIKDLEFILNNQQIIEEKKQTKSQKQLKNFLNNLVKTALSLEIKTYESHIDEYIEIEKNMDEIGIVELSEDYKQGTPFRKIKIRFRSPVGFLLKEKEE